MMDKEQKNRTQAWIGALAVNAVIFTLLWIAFIRIPAPVQSETSGIGHRPSSENGGTDAGATFGQITHLMGDNNGAGADNISGVPPDLSGPQPVNVAQPGASGSQSGSPGTSGTTSSPEPEQWVDEFYLDRGPPISFAPRLNPDGTPRSQPDDSAWTKSPTYEEEAVSFNSMDYNPPVMTPGYFSKLDIPERLRDLNFSLTVRVHLDARGRVLGVPEIISGSGHREVDVITIQNIMNNVTFQPATRKDTGEPVPIIVDMPIFYQDR